MTKNEYDFGNTFFEITEQVIDLAFKWNFYKQIYKSNSSTVTNSTSPIFFAHLKRMLQEKIILTITRLLDKPYSINRNTRKKTENVSFFLLFKQFPKEYYSIRDICKFRTKIKAYRKKYNASIFRFRNKIIAHNDFPTKRKGNSENIISTLFSNSDFDEAVEFIFSFTSYLTDFIKQKSLPFDNSFNFFAHPYSLHFLGNNADADQFISKLSDTEKVIKSYRKTTN